MMDDLVSRIAQANARMRETGLCICEYRRDPKPHATVLWIFANGNEVPLCDECCAIWLINSKEDPSLAPERIHSIE